MIQLPGLTFFTYGTFDLALFLEYLVYSPVMAPVLVLDLCRLLSVIVSTDLVSLMDRLQAFQNPTEMLNYQWPWKLSCNLKSVLLPP